MKSYHDLIRKRRRVDWLNVFGSACIVLALILLPLCFAGCPGHSVQAGCTRAPDGTITCGITVNPDGSNHDHNVEPK
jgi:hypothetical protein